MQSHISQRIHPERVTLYFLAGLLHGSGPSGLRMPYQHLRGSYNGSCLSGISTVSPLCDVRTLTGSPRVTLAYLPTVFARFAFSALGALPKMNRNCASAFRELAQLHRLPATFKTGYRHLLSARNGFACLLFFWTAGRTCRLGFLFLFFFFWRYVTTQPLLPGEFILFDE